VNLLLHTVYSVAVMAPAWTRVAPYTLSGDAQVDDLMKNNAQPIADCLVKEVRRVCAAWRTTCLAAEAGSGW